MSRHLVILFLALLFCYASGQNLETHKYFIVAPYGNSLNSGTIDSPFQSFEDAQNAVRKFKNQYPNIPVTIYFRGGKYYREKPVVFRSEDSGSSEGCISYLAYPGETPILIGGETDPHKMGITWGWNLQDKGPGWIGL